MNDLHQHFDQTPRWVKIGDALSQLLNVTFLSRHKETTANESISGRCYRCGWKRTEKVINFLFSWLEKDHCRLAYENDIERAMFLISSTKQIDL